MKGEILSIENAEKLARIDKAIGYIEKNMEERKSWLYGIPDYKVFNGNIEEVLKILKGENNE